MKQYKILAIFFALILALGACEDTNENLVTLRGAAVVPMVSNVSPAFFTDDYENTFIRFDVDLAAGESVDNAELQVTFKGQTAVVKPIASFPATITLTAKEAMQALGISAGDIQLGDYFAVNVATTSNGLRSISSAAVKASVTCMYDMQSIAGSYHWVSADWETEGDCEITLDPTDPFTLILDGKAQIDAVGLPWTGNDIALTINPNNFMMSGERVILSYEGWWGYVNFHYTPITGEFNSCENSFKMTFYIGMSSGPIEDDKIVGWGDRKSVV